MKEDKNKQQHENEGQNKSNQVEEIKEQRN